MNTSLIIVGWNEKTRDLINEIMDQQYYKQIVLIDSTLDVLPQHFQSLTFINDHAYNDEVLYKAGINDAETILISSDASLTEKEADKHAILICVTAKGCNPNIKVITEIKNDYQVRNARSAGADAIIRTNRLTSQVLYHHSKNSNFGQFLEHLYVQQFNRTKATDNFIGKTILDCTSDMMKERELLIGLVRNKQILINPDPDVTIQQNDELLTLKNDHQITLN